MTTYYPDIGISPSQERPHQQVLAHQLDHGQHNDVLEDHIPSPRGRPRQRRDKGGWLRFCREEDRGKARGRDQQGRSLRKKRGVQQN